MPLNILHHKSWNIYNKETQARIAQDEAEAQAREEAYNQRLQEYNATKRLAVLQGRSPPPPPEPPEDDSRKRRHVDDEHGRHDQREKQRKRVKLQGEDDTDRDLRLAKAHLEDAAGINQRSNERAIAQRAKRSRIDPPLTGQDGHIDLFPIDAKAQRDAEQETVEKRKQQELQDQFTMRLSNAAGRDGFKDKPWYSNAATGTLADTKRIARSIDSAKTTEAYPEAKGGVLDLYHKPSDAWGRPDPARKEREKARLAAADPLSAMQIRWKKTKEHKEAKAEREKEREEELKRLEKEQRRIEREERRERRRRRHGERDKDADSLDGFSLDALSKGGDRDRDRHRHKGKHSYRDKSRDADKGSRTAMRRFNCGNSTTHQ